MPDDSPEEKIAAKSLQPAVLGGLIKKRFLLSAAAHQSLSALPNC
jgi:hypothetical protein